MQMKTKTETGSSMTLSKTKSLVASAVLLGCASAAQAGFVTIDSALPVQNTIGIVHPDGSALRCAQSSNPLLLQLPHRA
jgi:uncharacterized lipoprotein YajG